MSGAEENLINLKRSQFTKNFGTKMGTQKLFYCCLPINNLEFELRRKIAPKVSTTFLNLYPNNFL